jgi:hypothetical protein
MLEQLRASTRVPEMATWNLRARLTWFAAVTLSALVIGWTILATDWSPAVNASSMVPRPSGKARFHAITVSVA